MQYPRLTSVYFVPLERFAEYLAVTEARLWCSCNLRNVEYHIKYSSFVSYYFQYQIYVISTLYAIWYKRLFIFVVIA